VVLYGALACGLSCTDLFFFKGLPCRPLP